MKIRIHALLLFLGLSVGCATGFAEESGKDVSLSTSASTAVFDPTLKSALTPEFLETKIKEAEADTALDEATRTKLIELYRKGLSELQAATALEQKAIAYKQALETAPTRAKAIRERLEAETGEAATDFEKVPDDLSVPEIEQRVAKVEADSVAVAAKLSEIEKELERSAFRPEEARRAIGAAKQALDGLETAIAVPSLPGEPQALVDARRWTLEARRQSLRSEILMLDQELLSQSARIDLAKASRDKAAADLERLKAAAQALQERLNRRLKQAAAAAAVQTKKAQEQAEDKHPLMQHLARSNADLSDELTALTDGLNRIAGVQDRIEEQMRQVEEDFRSARQRVEAAGLTQALGQALLDQRNQSPDTRSYRKAAVERKEATTQAALSQIRYTEEKRRLRDLDAYVASNLPGEIPAIESEDLRAELHMLAAQRKGLLDHALQTVESYLRALGELDHASSQLIQLVDDYEGFLDERLLWVRSSSQISVETFTALPVSLLWLISPTNWLEVARVLRHEVAQSPLTWGLLLIASLLQWKTRAMRRAIRNTAEPLRRTGTDDIRYTLKALLLSMLIAAPLPLLLATAGVPLYASLEATDFTKAIGQGAISVALGVCFLLSFRMLCIRGGVADRHFRWSGETLNLLQRNFDWLLALLAPLGLVATAAYNHPSEIYSGSLGRLSLLALTLGFALFFARILHPKRGVLRNQISGRPESWFGRTQRLWYPLVVTMPLGLALLTVVGYVYTVGILLGSLVSSVYLLLGITVVHQTVVRWLVLTRRRLVLQAALERNAVRLKEQAVAREPRKSERRKVEEPDEIDYASLDGQTRRLVSVLLFLASAAILWAIWSPLLPAFGILEEVTLWHHTGIVDGEERPVPFTLADIGIVLLIFLVAVLAARNLPALFEILLLSRTSVSAGSRYAIITMTGYVIVAIAVLAVFSALGLSWSSVQWLVAALGVGIGFGLQEIVANFISGIIILFERPVRVGDVVTIGDTTGTVSKIRIRATTIRNWEKQELLVPNKEFITGRLLNWTLSDNLNRIFITVGVDYETDVPLALKLLEEAVKEHKHVLEDPIPRFSFEGFGDNALTLVVRCFLASMDDRLTVTSELHQSINAKFRAAGISIAFPQRDVHLSTVQPLDVRVHRTPPDLTGSSPESPETNLSPSQ